MSDIKPVDPAHASADDETQAEKQEVTTSPYHLTSNLPSDAAATDATHDPSHSPRLSYDSLSRSFKRLGKKDAWFGRANFNELFVPRLFPWSSRRTTRIREQASRQIDYEEAVAAGSVGNDKGDEQMKEELPFYGLDEDLPIFLAAVCGLQHMMAMLAGIITPPIILSSSLNLPSAQQSYLISASLITSGLLSAVQMSRIPFRLPGFLGGGKRQLGSGVLSVVGTSFATLSTASAIFASLYANGTCPMIVNAEGTTSKGPCPDAYGYLLGTSAVCALLEIFLSFMPIRVLKRIFPPIITGGVVFLIGASLIGESGGEQGRAGCNVRCKD